ncbi:tetratricopeptide repeat protein [Massilia sp. S19_KUP03_FR1]|uniref:tetratricopeptide repeat protein n=1 Tax=Massilia sp. S19_KUP03_FR1 TaxID=3025503 RepID=UPI002FCD9209
MQLKHSPGMTLAALLASLCMLCTLAACQSQDKPTSAEIETIGMKARQQNDENARRSLVLWSSQNMPVAQRELAILYKSGPSQRSAALRLFEQSARAGDPEAAFELGDMLRLGAVGVAPAPEASVAWYAMAAARKHAKAALMLGMLYKNGDGVVRDDAQAAYWLDESGKLGNPHAMFLLSNMYKEGQGRAKDLVRARYLLEQAAEHEYPPAIQELAMIVQLGDKFSAKNERHAGDLMKEATEHRHNNWNRF